MSFVPKYTITIPIAKCLVSIEASRNNFENISLSPALLKSLRNSARLMATHYSTQIEGNRLTMEEVENVVVKNVGGLPGRERDETEVANYYKALEYVETKYHQPLSEKIIKTIHGLVLNGKKVATAYRDGQNVIRDGITNAIVYMPPETKDVGRLMKELVNWIKIAFGEKKIPIPVIAALAHYQIATIHPFYDGNGRTARLVTNYILHFGGYGLKGIYSLEEYYAKNLAAYYKALAVEEIPNYYMGRAEADLTDFLHYFISGMADAFNKIASNTKQNANPTIGSVLNSMALRELSTKQRIALELFIKQKEISASDLAHFLGVSNRSAALQLKKWTEQSFVIIGNASKKGRTYLLHPKFENLLMEKN